ncbi:hypothetical protein [Hathewaya massiliensis]|uniref:hypothetical protein n=1 Tax=Hathewaya massiliensis TaxID=1964382 RepID=UPI00115A3C6E|nr:hypothetical protein [Hathewaya massiliensis]
MSKSYCMRCKKEVSETTIECECGGRFFVYGDNFHLGEKGVVCDCGSDKFKSGAHIDCTDKAINNYICTNCGNLIGTESYRSEEDMMRWGD